MKNRTDDDFFRFPHTPHLAWLGDGSPRDDKVLTTKEADILLSHNVVIEEKLDGANLGLSVSPTGELRAQNRGQYLLPPYKGQFEQLSQWLETYQDLLFDALDEHLILFGEWCAARHTLFYSHLPNLFIVFDIYDKKQQLFWSTSRRDKLTNTLGLTAVSCIMRGHTSLQELERKVLSETSRYGTSLLEGVVIRQESIEWLQNRAKLVHPDFTQTIDKHWKSRIIEWNHLKDSFISNELKNHKKR